MSDHDRDRGVMSIVEMMVSVGVMAIIATVLVAVVTTFLRNDASASQRIDESRDLQQLSAYMPLDVSSAFADELELDTDTGDGYLDAAKPSTPVSCPGYSTPGNNVLSLEWGESFGGQVKQYRVQYRTQVVDTETRLVRVQCSGGTTLGTANVKVMARQLRTTNPVTVLIDGGHVTMTMYEKTGRVLRVSSTTQNPHSELAPTSDFGD